MCKFKTGSKLKISWQKAKRIDDDERGYSIGYCIKGYGCFNIGVKDVIKLAEIYLYSDFPNHDLLILEAKMIADRE